MNGIFEYESGNLKMTPQELSLEASSGAALRGTFTLEGDSGEKVHGYLYPSNTRMLLDPVEFRGEKNEIRYQFDCSGLKKGSLSEGKIVICCDCGEYELPYTVKVAEETGQESLPFSDLDSFALMAKTDEQKAYQSFMDPGFRALLREQPALLSLYEGLLAQEADREVMEEFLVGAGLKKPMTFSMDEEEIDFGELTEPVSEKIRLQRDTWGFRHVQAESDALFLRPEHRDFTTDDFTGSSYDLNLILDANLMHAGNNYARLTLRAGRQTLIVRVAASRPGSRQHLGHTRRVLMKELENLYISFRLQKMDVSSWIEHSVSVINGYKRVGGEDVFADLFLIQLYFADNKKQKAQKLLEQVEEQKERLDNIERYCYYLYLSTFFYREESYVDRVEEEVSAQQISHPTSWPLLWILLYLQETYLDDATARYDAVAKQFQRGCRNRILYVEAWQVLKQDPFLLRHLGEFELHLLRFADEEKVMTAEVLRQAASLTMHQRRYDRRLFRVLSDGWQLYPSDDLLRAICQLLIRSDRQESSWFQWYELGVKRGLRMNGLQEGYLATMDTENLCFRELPQVVRLYFGYDTSMDYHRRAAIYRSIADDRKQDSQTWYNFRPAIERFVMEQLGAEHLTRDLMVLYRTILRENMLTAPLAEKLVRMLFTYEVTCEDDAVCQVVVHSSRAIGEHPTALTEGKTTVRIYDPDSALIAVDAGGHRYASAPFCQVDRIFAPETAGEDDARKGSPSGQDHLDTLMAWCAKKVPEYPGIVTFLCTESVKSHLINEGLLPYFRNGCEWGGFSEEFREELRREVLNYYMEHPRDPSLPEFLDGISFREYALVDKTTMITLLAEEGRCTAAFELLDSYGAEDIPLIQLVRICSRMVLELEFEENAMLLSLCCWCFDRGKYDDKLLRYLILYYEGSVESMVQVWQSACQFGLDTMMLEEKILTMMLFTREGTRGSEQIFESYWKKLGRMKLCRAYVNLKSYEYFVKGIPVADSVFAFIEEEYAHLRKNGRMDEQEEVCRLALLQHYARAASLNETQRGYAAEMLDEFQTKNMRFAFFRRFDRELLKPYYLQGHVFAEYACNPKSRVKILYRCRTEGESGEEADFTEEEVPDRFEGIFVHEFVLLDGEEVECFFVEDNGTEEIRSDKWILKGQQEESPGDDHSEDKYAMLNRLSAAAQKQDDEAWQETLDTWLTLDHLTEQVFTLV